MATYLLFVMFTLLLPTTGDLLLTALTDV